MVVLFFRQVTPGQIEVCVIDRRVFSQSPANDNATSIVNQYDNAMRNILKTMTVVVVMLFICITPNQILWLLQSLNVVTVDFGGWAYYMCTLIQICNACVNPLIYALKYKDFKRGCKQMLHKMDWYPSSVNTKVTRINVGTASASTWQFLFSRLRISCCQRLWSSYRNALSWCQFSVTDIYCCKNT